LESDFQPKDIGLLADKWFNFTLLSNCCVGYTTKYGMTKHTMSHKS